MKLYHIRPSQGSILVSAAVAAAILSILVAGLLKYFTNEYFLNFRSHAWTQAMHLAEAGVEVGFAELRYQYYQGGSGFTTGRGWTDLGGGSYSNRVSNFQDTAGNTIGYLDVIVSGVGTSSPQIQGDRHLHESPGVSKRQPRGAGRADRQQPVPRRHGLPREDHRQRQHLCRQLRFIGQGGQV